MARTPKRTPRPLPTLQVAPDAWPAREVEMWPIDSLKAHPHNVRTHPEAQLDDLRESFAAHGVVKPFVITDKGVILAGHGSTAALAAYKHAGVTEVPVVVVRGWSDDQERAFMLRDNKLTERGGWDKDALGIELLELSALPTVDLKTLGFRQAELDRLIKPQLRAGATDPDAAPEVPPAPVSRRGDIWLLGEHRLICGDATNAEHVAALLAGERPNLMVTDPPYGVEYDPDWRNEIDRANGAPIGARAVGQVANDHRADWREAWALFAGDVAYVWHGALHAGTVEASLLAVGFETRAQIIWAKDRHVISRGDYHWQHEPCWYAVRKDARGNWCGDRSQTTLWEISHPKSETGHGTQKPLACMQRPMLNNSRPGELVYDPFCGSGTTIIAAESAGRRARAIELEPAYVDVAVRRWEGYAGKNAILAAGEQRFAEVAAQRLGEVSSSGVRGASPKDSGAVAA